MLFILLTVIIVASLAVCMRSGKCHKKTTENDDEDLSTNYNYGISMHPMPTECGYSMENAYDTPNAVFPGAGKLVTKRNEAYNVGLNTVDEVTKPTQDCNNFEYDYVQ